MSDPAGQQRAVRSAFFPLDARVLSRDPVPRWGVVVDEGPMPSGLVPVLWDGDFSAVTEPIADLLLVPPPAAATGPAQHSSPASPVRRRRRIPGFVFLGSVDGAEEDSEADYGDVGDSVGYGDGNG